MRITTPSRLDSSATAVLFPGLRDSVPYRCRVTVAFNSSNYSWSSGFEAHIESVTDIFSVLTAFCQLFKLVF